MSALTADRNTPIMGAGRFKQSYPVAASTTIYKGSIVAINAAGNAVPAGAAGLQTVGIALAHVDNSAGAAAALSVEVQEEVGLFVNGSSFTKADVGKKASASDDQTISTYSTSSSTVNLIRQVDSNGVWVDIGLPYVGV